MKLYYWKYADRTYEKLASGRAIWEMSEQSPGVFDFDPTPVGMTKEEATVVLAAYGLEIGEKIRSWNDDMFESWELRPAAT